MLYIFLFYFINYSQFYLIFFNYPQKEKQIANQKENQFLQMVKPENLTTGKGKIIQSQAREIIYRVFVVIGIIKSFLPPRGRGRSTEILELATGVSERTIQEIQENFKEKDENYFQTPVKKNNQSMGAIGTRTSRIHSQRDQKENL